MISFSLKTLAKTESTIEEAATFNVVSTSASFFTAKSVKLKNWKKNFRRLSGNMSNANSSRKTQRSLVQIPLETSDFIWFHYGLAVNSLSKEYGIDCSELEINLVMGSWHRLI